MLLRLVVKLLMLLFRGVVRVLRLVLLLMQMIVGEALVERIRTFCRGRRHASGFVTATFGSVIIFV